jgi:hypothetical protein
VNDTNLEEQFGERQGKHVLLLQEQIISSTETVTDIHVSNNVFSAYHKPNIQSIIFTDTQKMTWNAYIKYTKTWTLSLCSNDIR